MRGKVGLIVGVGVGYVLGSRAGRERYEQIKRQWLKFWNLDPVQERVGAVKRYAASSVAAIPRAVWRGSVSLVKAVTDGGTPGQRLDAAIATGEEAADDVVAAVQVTVSDEAKQPEETTAKKPAARSASGTTAAKKTPAEKTPTKKKA